MASLSELRNCIFKFCPGFCASTAAKYYELRQELIHHTVTHLSRLSHGKQGWFVASSGGTRYYNSFTARYTVHTGYVYVYKCCHLKYISN